VDKETVKSKNIKLNKIKLSIKTKIFPEIIFSFGQTFEFITIKYLILHTFGEIQLINYSNLISKHYLDYGGY